MQPIVTKHPILHAPQPKTGARILQIQLMYKDII